MMDDDFAQLRTPRLYLRRFQASDIDAFARYRSDPSVAQHQGWDAPYPVERATEFVTTMATAVADVPGEWLQIAIARTADDSLIGDCAFAPKEHEPRTAEIGFTVAAEHQGLGHAREAISLLLRYLFDDLGKHRVTASCDSRNVPSAKVLAAVGMRQEGHLVESTWSNNEWTDDLLFAILEREWRQSAANARSGTRPSAPRAADTASFSTDHCAAKVATPRVRP